MHAVERDGVTKLTRAVVFSHLYGNRTWEVVTGCTPLSAGCKNCFAKEYFGGAFPKVTVNENVLGDPFLWPSSMVQVCELSDLFHEEVPLWFHHDVLNVIQETPQHRYLVLTKRPEIVLANGLRIPDNVLFGFSAEDQHFFDIRWEYVRRIDAAFKFVSLQPLLGAIDIGGAELDWVIAGEEYGTGARPSREEHFSSLLRQCEARGIPFSLTQRVVDGITQVYPMFQGKKHDYFPMRG